MTTHRHEAGALAAFDAVQPLEFSVLLESFRRRLDEELAGWLLAREERAANQVPATTELTAALGEFVARGGKRLRPALLFHAYLGCGGEAEESALPLAMAVELLHTYLLIHDDIMDHAGERRGRPAAHVGYRALHREQSWRSDPDHFGVSAAILLGDLAQAWAVELFWSTEIEAAVRRRLHGRFSVMCEEVILGQYLEVTAGDRSDLDEEHLLRILQMKSGRYSVQRPIELGALLAGAPEATLEALSEYGAATGEAFQLQDDLLGMFGDPSTTGKPVGEDLTEGKLTVLVFKALERLADDERRFLAAALGDADLSPEAIARAQRLIEASGAREAVEEMIDERLEAARSALSRADLEPVGVAFFSGLIDYLRNREA